VSADHDAGIVAIKASNFGNHRFKLPAIFQP
jgi:hypothetical protein